MELIGFKAGFPWLMLPLEVLAFGSWKAGNLSPWLFTLSVVGGVDVMLTWDLLPPMDKGCGMLPLDVCKPDVEAVGCVGGAMKGDPEGGIPFSPVNNDELPMLPLVFETEVAAVKGLEVGRLNEKLGLAGSAEVGFTTEGRGNP